MRDLLALETRLPMVEVPSFSMEACRRMPDMLLASPVDRLSSAKSLRRSRLWKRVEVVGRENPPPPPPTAATTSFRALSGDRFRTSPSVSIMPAFSAAAGGGESPAAAKGLDDESLFGTETVGLVV